MSLAIYTKVRRLGVLRFNRRSQSPPIVQIPKISIDSQTVGEDDILHTLELQEQTISLVEAKLFRSPQDRLFFRAVTTIDGFRLKVICKISYGTTLKRGMKEADIYEIKLLDLMGSYVPAYYGSFDGDLLGEPAICILLEDLGEDSDLSGTGLVKTSWKFKEALLRLVVNLHDKKGIEHRDIRPCNVLTRNGTPVLIDFEDARPHDCERTESVSIGALLPRAGAHEYGCAELFDVMLKTGSFISGYIEVEKRMIRTKGIRGPEDIAKQYQTRWMTYEQALETSKVAWEEWLTAMARYWDLPIDKFLEIYRSIDV